MTTVELFNESEKITNSNLEFTQKQLSNLSDIQHQIFLLVISNKIRGLGRLIIYALQKYVYI